MSCCLYYYHVFPVISLYLNQLNFFKLLFFFLFSVLSESVFLLLTSAYVLLLLDVFFLILVVFVFFLLFLKFSFFPPIILLNFFPDMALGSCKRPPWNDLELPGFATGICRTVWKILDTGWDRSVATLPASGLADCEADKGMFVTCVTSWRTDWG